MSIGFSTKSSLTSSLLEGAKNYVWGADLLLWTLRQEDLDQAQRNLTCALRVLKRASLALEEERRCGGSRAEEDAPGTHEVFSLRPTPEENLGSKSGLAQDQVIHEEIRKRMEIIELRRRYGVLRIAPPTSELRFQTHALDASTSPTFESSLESDVLLLAREEIFCTELGFTRAEEFDDAGHPRRLAVAARAGDALVGGARVVPDAWDARVLVVDRLWVMPEYRRRGAWRQLLRRVAEVVASEAPAGALALRLRRRAPNAPGLLARWSGEPGLQKWDRSAEQGAGGERDVSAWFRVL